MRRKIIIYAGIAIVLGAIAWLLIGGNVKHKSHVVKRQPFKVSVNTKGEIHGAKATIISLSNDLMDRALNVWNYEIEDLVAEGAIVKKGDYVARLKSDQLRQRMQEVQQTLTKTQADFQNAQLDSTIQLTQLREEIKNYDFDLAYRQIELEQAKYESPAYQRKAEIAYNQALRMFDKMKRDYEIKRMNLKVKIQRTKTQLDEQVESNKKIMTAIAATTIKAPEDGMVIYARAWGDQKIKIGDNVSRWNPNIATLPDLSVLNSETFIKEIDIAKIDIGDSVNITVDALPDYKFTGVVHAIANMGQEQNSGGGKVFKVKVRLNQQNENLKPNMNTMNAIYVSNYPDTLAIPLKAVFYENGFRYVFLKKKGDIVKQVINTGVENEESVIVGEGLEEGDRILLYQPEEHENYQLIVNKS